MDIIVANATFGTPPLEAKPFLLNWSRLEPLPVTPELEAGLEARIGDPLWLLGRQWSFNEFQGEDAGTPIDARIALEQAKIDRLRFGPEADAPSANTSDYQPLGLPVEIAVEAEVQPRLNARVAAEAGLQCLRRLRAANLVAAAKAIRAAFPLAQPSVDTVSDTQGFAWLALLGGRATDGLAVAAALTPFRQADGTLNGLPAIVGLSNSGAEGAKIREVLSTWLAEYRACFTSGVAGRSAWVPSRQEYTFAARANLTDGTRVALKAAEYTGGQVDWHSFTIDSDPGLGDPAVAVPATTLTPSPKLPVPVRYPGMPADRYWEFENDAVSFGQTSAGPTSLMRALLTEFATIYGSDWFYLPFDLEVGSLCSITSLKVRDTFGTETNIGPVQGTAGHPWRMYELTSVGNAASRRWFFLAPALAARLQGDSIEEVAYFRDEMACMAWGVERRISSSADGSVDRALETYSSILHQDISGDNISAEIVYRLQTDVPDRWIPLVPVALPVTSVGTPVFSHWLERRAIIRTMPDGSRATIQPGGMLLRTNPSQDPATEPALRIADEEIPREGAVVRRVFEYARWLDGTSHLWLGRKKLPGKGEGASDLRHDVLVRRVPVAPA